MKKCDQDGSRLPQHSVERPWGILSPFTTCLRLPVISPCQKLTKTSGDFVNQVVFLTVNHRGPLPLRELLCTDETIVCRDPRWSWTCFQHVYDYEWIHPVRGCDTDKWRLCKPGGFSYGKSPRTPSLEGSSLHRRSNFVVEIRDPGGSWACLRLRVQTPRQRLWPACKNPWDHSRGRNTRWRTRYLKRPRQRPYAT